MEDEEFETEELVTYLAKKWIEDNYSHVLPSLKEILVDCFENAYILGQESVPDHCPHCGTTEMLCGYNGPGCSKEEEYG